MINYLSYIFCTEKTLVPGFGACFMKFKHTVPERHELEELAEDLKKANGAKTVLFLGYFPVYEKPEVDHLMEEMSL